MKDKEIVQEWVRYLQSSEYEHSIECGTLSIAKHFTEWQRMRTVELVKGMSVAMLTRRVRRDVKEGYRQFAERLIKELTETEDIQHGELRGNSKAPA